MKKLTLLSLIAVLTSMVSVGQQPTLNISGKWIGVLSIQGTKLRLVLNFKQDNASITATLDSPDQGAKGIPVKEVVYRNDSLIVNVASIMGWYKAAIASDTVMNGVWQQGGISLPLIMVKQLRPFAAGAPSPFYDSREVKILNEKANVTLAGTLTIPKNTINCPALILVSGSGPQDRNEELLGHKPFLRIADYLSSRGIAVLRYDDRGTNESTGNFQTSTSFDFADDAEAAFAFLRNQPGINPKKVGIVGHSEGGMIAPIVASRNKDVAFIILLAGPGITGEEILVTQNKAMFSKQGLPDDSIKRMTNLNKEMVDIIAKNQNDREAIALIKQAIAKQNFSQPIQEAYLRAYSAYVSPWFRTFITFNPTPYLSQVTCSVLAINGSNDLQILPKENLVGIEKALRSGKNTKYEILEMRGYNHLFQESVIGLPDEYSNTDKPAMNNVVLEKMEVWIKALPAI